MDDKKIETLFIKDVSVGGFYVTMNVDLIKASRIKCKLKGFEITFLSDVCSYWESNTRYNRAHTPLKASLRELATDYNVSPTSIQAAIKKLLELDLIRRGDNGKRNSKCAYYPNVGLLKKNLIEYVKLSHQTDGLKDEDKDIFPTGHDGLKDECLDTSTDVDRFRDESPEAREARLKARRDRFSDESPEAREAREARLKAGQDRFSDEDEGRLKARQDRFSDEDKGRTD
jgi:hypothetical protein